MLVFDVELIDMPTRAPADVKAPPADAKRTASGLAYKVLKAGTGRAHPKATDMVMVHYTGWTTDGKMFDSSVVRGQPATFPLNGVIAGWTEGVQLMVEGEKTRFWIPEALAYKGQPGRPKGMLVFDVELLRINYRQDRQARAQGYRPFLPSCPSSPPALPAPSALSVIRRHARANRSVSARRTSSGTGPMRAQLACA